VETIIDSNIIGQSAPITHVKSLINMHGQYPAPVLITGETGTGKELAARGLHYSGVLADKPFIAINCSTFSDAFFLSELFGYTKNAFSGAKTDKEGLLLAANGGTLFFDEIDSLSLKSQASILRLLQESEFRPVGSSQVLKANVRIIAAANCNLSKRIKTGEFRQDLYFRLFILTINMPPLRERMDDLVLLIGHFINKFNREYGLQRTGLCENLLDKLKHHHWPGNVRELENTIHRCYLTCSGPLVSDVSMLDAGTQRLTEINPMSCISSNIHTPEPERKAEKVKNSHKSEQDWLALEIKPPEGGSELIDFSLDFAVAKRRTIEDFEASFVTQLMQQAKGNVTKAAKLCGKERRAFGKLIKKYNIRQ
jgi:DNA-binding NtrC family response regulator